ncbi:MAG: DMT family transporter [Pseudomonadota bacterium]|uniref:DMT family transporter n=1 Tax=Fodinicurvata fenggangensis TaxID=1121830 RepID=UPI00138E520E|nr:DMT family transporter [Fodinicurvata fenggangensis]
MSTHLQPVNALSVAAANRRGIFWMLFAVFLFVSMDGIAKTLSQSYDVAQIVWARYTFHVLIMVALLNLRLPALLHTRRLPLQLFRSLMLLVTTSLFFLGISHIPLAEAAAVMLAVPLIVTALSMPLLGEPVGIRRWTGVFLGFAGALIIIRPGSDIFDPATLYVLAAACTNGLYHINTRQLSQSESPMTTLTYSALVGMIVMFFVVPFFWTTPDFWGWVGLISIGAIGGASHFCIIKAYQAAAAAVVAPFNYSNILWATFYGFLLFGDLPDGFTVLGAAILIASGLYVFYREQKKQAASQ